MQDADVDGWMSVGLRKRDAVRRLFAAKLETAEIMEGVALNKRAPYFCPAPTRFSYHQVTFRQRLINIGSRNRFA